MCGDDDAVSSFKNTPDTLLLRNSESEQTELSIVKEENIECDAENDESKMRVMELNTEDIPGEADSEQKNEELSAQEEIRKLKGIILDSRIHTTRLENQLENRRELIKLISEDRQVLLSAVTILNERIEHLTEVNLELEYEVELSSKLHGLQEQKKSDKDNYMELRAIKAENSLEVANIQVNKWKGRYEELFDRLKHLEYEKTEQSVNTDPSDSDDLLLLENTALRKQLEHLCKIMDSMDSGPSVVQKPKVEQNSKRKRNEKTGGIINAQTIPEAPAAATKSTCPATRLADSSGAEEANLMDILRPYRAKSGYVINMDASVIRLFGSLNECEEKKLLEIEQRLFKWNIRCDVCGVSIGFRSIRNLFEHLIGGNHQIALRKSESRVSQRAFDQWEKMLRENKKESVQQVKEVRPTATVAPTVQVGSNDTEGGVRHLVGCNVREHKTVSAAQTSLRNVTNMWKKLDSVRKKELQTKRRGWIAKCELCNKDKLSFDSFFHHIGSIVHLEKVKQNKTKVCEEAVNAVMKELNRK